MMRKIKLRKLLTALCAALVLMSLQASAFAQCAMCKATLQASASANTQAASDTFNLAVLVLLIPPVLLFVAFFLILLKYGRGSDEGGLKALKAAFD